MIGQFAAGSGKKAGEFYTPQHMSSILSSIVALDSQESFIGKKRHLDSVFDFACGSGSLLLNVRSKLGANGIGKIYGQERNITTCNQARMNMLLHGVPAYIRSENGPEFIAEAVRNWIAAVGAQTAYIEPASLWENGYVESFNARFRDELLNGEMFYTLKEAQIIIEQWRRHFNTKRPHSSPGYRLPAPEAIIPLQQRPTIN